MLGSVAMILLIVWALATVSSYTLSGWIHLLLIAALAAMLLRIADRRRMSRAEWKRAIEKGI